MPRKTKEERRAYRREYQGRNPGRKRTDSLRWRYNITAGEWAARWIAQAGHCLICHERPIGHGLNGLCVDHDHDSGEVRGLLCVHCNSSLGWLENNREAVEAYARV